jgi:hypothetical protein
VSLLGDVRGAGGEAGEHHECDGCYLIFHGDYLILSKKEA